MEDLVADQPDLTGIGVGATSLAPMLIPRLLGDNSDAAGERAVAEGYELLVKTLYTWTYIYMILDKKKPVRELLPGAAAALAVLLLTVDRETR